MWIAQKHFSVVSLETSQVKLNCRYNKPLQQVVWFTGQLYCTQFNETKCYDEDTDLHSTQRNYQMEVPMPVWRWNFSGETFTSTELNHWIVKLKQSLNHYIDMLVVVIVKMVRCAVARGEPMFRVSILAIRRVQPVQRECKLFSIEMLMHLQCNCISL